MKFFLQESHYDYVTEFTCIIQNNVLYLHKELKYQELSQAFG